MRTPNFRLPALFLLSTWILVGIAHADPSIHILSVPNYGSPGDLTGVVSGVNVQDYQVATYIHVEGLGWETKPNAVMRTVPLNADGTFSVPFGTAGLDNRATIFATALVPKAYRPPPAVASGRIPASLTSLAIDYKQRYSRTTDFAGYQWGVKESPGGAGPGSNRFSNSPQDVFVDKQGLHLTLHKHTDNNWYATEVINTKPLGFGTYVVQTNSRVDNLDPFVTFGAFTWDSFGDDTRGPSANRELDFEDARFGFAADKTNSQFVVQPFNEQDHLVRYTVPDQTTDPALTRIMQWSPTSIHFLALAGHHSATDYDAKDILAQWTYTGVVPDPGRAQFRFNLWPANVLLGGAVNEPSSGLPQEVIVSGFSFTPQVPEPSTWIGVAMGLGALGICTMRRRLNRQQQASSSLHASYLHC